MRRRTRDEVLTVTGPSISPQDARSLVATFEEFDPSLSATWRTALSRAIESPELDAKTRAILVVGLDGIVHWSLPVIEAHINDAFEAGACIREIIEAVMHLSSLEGGTHTLH